MTLVDRSSQAEILRLFEMQPRAEVVPWLQSHICLPERMAPGKGGPFRTSLRRYQEAILECWNPDSGVNHCGVSAGVQTAKTTILVLGVAYRIHHSPLPTLIVGSSKEWCKNEISEKRLQPLIEENPILAAHKPLDSDRFRAMAMDMDGGYVNLVGGNSPGALSGGSYGIVAVDEAAKLRRETSEEAPEAHPFYLAEKRADGFGAMAFHYRSSTPNHPSHPFWKYILAGDQTRFYVPCPHCHEWFYLDFIGRAEDREEYTDATGIKVASDYRSIIWSQDAKDSRGYWDETKVAESTRYICPHNGCEIAETDRHAMIEQCEERRHNPLAAKNRRSFIIPSLYSPTVSFASIAWAFLDTRADLFGLQDLYNSRLARPWTEYEVMVKLEHVEKCVRSYLRGTIPFKPRLLVLTADPGEVMTHWEVVALDGEGGAWVIDWGTVLSSRELLSREFLRARIYTVHGTEEKIAPQLGYIDSGWMTDFQYDVCLASGGFLWPVKGSDAKHGSFTETRAASRPQLRLYGFSDRQAKNELYGERLHRQKNGGLHLPADADPALKLGHANQRRDQAGEWARVAQDHFGDCTKYAVIALWIARAAGLFR